MRLGPVGVIGGGFLFDQVLHVRDALVLQQVVLVGRAGESRPYACSLQPQQKLARLRQRLHAVEEFLLEDEFAKGLQRPFHVLLLPPWDEHRDELVAAFADLAAYVFQLQEDADGAKRHLPSLRMEPVALHERSVNVTQKRFNHRSHHLICRSIVGCTVTLRDKCRHSPN